MCKEHSFEPMQDLSLHVCILVLGDDRICLYMSSLLLDICVNIEGGQA